MLLVSSLSYSQTDSLKNYWLIEDYDNAIIIGKTMISNNTANENDYILTAISLKSNLEYKKAINILKKGVNVYPNSNELKYYLATIYSSTGEKKKSEKIIDSLIINEPKNKNYLILALRIYQKDKIYKKALEVSNNLIKIDSTNGKSSQIDHPRTV
jgi:tetratricopeptide (TPR) repeat protein